MNTSTDDPNGQSAQWSFCIRIADLVSPFVAVSIGHVSVIVLVSQGWRCFRVLV